MAAAPTEQFPSGKLGMHFKPHAFTPRQSFPSSTQLTAPARPAHCDCWPGLSPSPINLCMKTAVTACACCVSFSARATAIALFYCSRPLLCAVFAPTRARRRPFATAERPNISSICSQSRSDRPHQQAPRRWCRQKRKEQRGAAAPLPHEAWHACAQPIVSRAAHLGRHLIALSPLPRLCRLNCPIACLCHPLAPWCTHCVGSALAPAAPNPPCRNIHHLRLMLARRRRRLQ